MDTPNWLARFDGALARRLGAGFHQRGHALFLVGGSVRDLILAKPTHDLDFTTDATPDQTREILGEAGPTGIWAIGEKFGTIGATFDGVVVEITTFRTESYRPGSRKPEVRYGRSLAEDLARRDFTINAMALDLTTDALVDPFGGQQDLRAGVIRAVGRPAERFAEDPLRLLRAVRFVGQLGFELDPETRAAIKECAELIRQVSRERIFEELNRLLIAPHATRGLRLLADLGLLDQFMPEVTALRGTTQGKRSKDVFEHTLRVIDRTPPDLVLRWAALLHDIGKPRTFIQSDGEIHFPGHELVGERLSAEILTRLHADSDLVARVSRLAGLHMRANQYEADWSDGAVRRLMRDVGPDLELLLLLSTSDVTSYRAAKVEAAVSRVRRLRERIQRLEEQARIEEIRSPLDGNDLMHVFGRGPGPWIKAVKEYLLDQVMEGKLAPDDRSGAEVLARRFVEAGQAA
ncbi:MAG: CCA tRNA nucleotidyltransferase [Chloroflexota bacterium]